MSAKNEKEAEVLSIEGHQVRVTHPDKLYFSRQTKLSKLDLVRYYLSIAPGALAGIRDRLKHNLRCSLAEDVERLPIAVAVGYVGVAVD